MQSKTNLICDSVHGTIEITDFEKRIISTRIFNRLHNISQNSTAYLTFPTNRTKRFEHSLGTMHLSGRIISNGFGNADKETIDDFFAHLRNEIDNLLRTNFVEKEDFYRDRLNDDNFDVSKIMKYEKICLNDRVYHLAIPKNIQEYSYVALFQILYQSVRIAGLLHDVGHPPMSHITEDALNNMYSYYSQEPNSNKTAEDFINCFSSFVKSNGHFDLHERIGQILATRLLKYTNAKVKKPDSILEFNSVLFELIVTEVTVAILTEKNSFFKQIHNIIDGAMDSDRLDYVYRDPLNSGIDLGKIEYDRILSTMRLIKYNGSEFWISPSLKMLDHVEDIFNKRWDLYKKIIFHHRVVKTDFLLMDCIERLSMRFINSDLGKNPNNEQIIIPYDISGLWKAVQSLPSHTKYFDKILQWDDGWLMAVLKKEFYSTYFGDQPKDILYYRLDELISNKKWFYSLIKKDAEVLMLEKSLIEAIVPRIQQIEDKLKKIMIICDDYKKIETNGIKYAKIDPAIQSLLQFIKILKDKHVNDGLNCANTLLVFKYQVCMVLFGDDKEYNEIIKSSIDKSLIGVDGVEDYFFSSKRVKTGLGQNLLLYSERLDGKLDTFHISDISETKRILELKQYSLIPIYIYLRKKSIETNLNFSQLITNIGSNLGYNIAESISKRIDSWINL